MNISTNDFFKSKIDKMCEVYVHRLVWESVCKNMYAYKHVYKYEYEYEYLWAGVLRIQIL